MVDKNPFRSYRESVLKIKIVEIYLSDFLCEFFVFLCGSTNYIYHKVISKDYTKAHKAILRRPHIGKQE